MYLKKVEIFGFKSFAEKTEIVFERGVTCVVGPNGCGKSNISDSIRWVLGERSAKLLRGSKMEDVIFSGTEFRKPLNLAEVSLTIDNTDQKLPIQYEEVVITRRLHRSGESEYLLNRTPCRLKDIQDLILDTGIGSNSYSMIEQGRIDYILNAEAEERRFLIEEAAGISKYKVKKEEALRKLERTEQNLLRLNDITSEVERNIRYAERQAQRAERYKEQLERLKTLEIKKAFFEVNQLNEQLNVLNQERKEQEQSLFEWEEKSVQHNASTRQIEERLQNLETQFFEQEHARSEAKQELTILENQERFHSEKIEFLKLAAEKALGEVEALTKRCASLTTELTAKEREGSNLTASLSELHREENELEFKFHKINQETFPQEELSRQQSVLFELAHQLTDLRNSIHKAQGELVANERTKINLNESHQKLIDTKNAYQLRHETINEKRTDDEKKRSEMETALSEEVENRGHLENTAERLKSDLDQIRSTKTQLEGKIRLLEELNHAYGSDPKKIVPDHNTQLQGATKTLLDLIRIEPGYELAVESVLMDALGAVVTDSVDTAAGLLQCLKESNLKQTTIFIQDQASPRTNHHVAPQSRLIKKSLKDVIHIEHPYSGVIAHLLDHAYVIEELNHQNIFELAPFAQDLKLVTKTGTAFGPNSQITLRNGGYTPERSAFARREELAKLARELEGVLKRETETNHATQKNEVKIKEIKDRERSLNRDVLELHSSVKQQEGTLTSVSEYVAQMDEEINLILKELKNNEIDIGKSKHQLEELTRQRTELERQESKEKEFISLIEQRIESHQSSKRDFENQASQMKAKINLALEKQASLQNATEFLTHQLTENTNHIAVLNDDRAKSFSQIDQLHNELAGFAAKKQLISKRVFELSVHAEQLKRERTEVSLLRHQAMEEVQTTNQALEAIKQKFHQHSLKEMEINHQNNSIAQNLQSRYKIVLSALNPTDFPLSQDELEKNTEETERLREKLESIGTVNLLAIEEYQELKERYDLLLNQKNDLVSAKESLLEAIRKINRTTKKLFEDTLVRVRESFREYYRVLFGGGYADLILIDELNPFESGLDIVARPPGKKTQHITLLSGGEKALTAIALLLALFSVKPSPFCVLDEVDAPLDESNNDRFLHVLKPFLETTQFIIVTHSRKTIAVGDALYGVTMQEPGVSKLVSVKLSQDSDAIEHSDAKVATELNQILN